ncbi:extracellular solute-binding protein [Catenulispora yoronensis]
MSVSRRDLLRNAGLAALALPLAACVTDNKAKSGTAASPSTVLNSGPVSASNPFGVEAARPLEVVVFSGGNGEKYATEVHEVMYKKEFPQSTIKHGATQKIGTTLRPRFISGDVPDVVNNSGPEALDVQALVAEGQVADLSSLFEAPAIGFDGKKIKDVVIGGVYESSLIDGVPRVLQYSVGHRALWYNAKLFQAKGWKVPTTWEEFKALGQTAKADNRTLFAYPGQVGPFYQLWNLLYTAAKIGGNKVIVDIDNLGDGAWQAPAMIQSVSAWVEIQTDFGDKSYFGLDHTQTQVRQLQDKVLFYPCGSWIEGEMAKDKPPPSSTPSPPSPASPPPTPCRTARSWSPAPRPTSSRPRARTRRAAWSTSA